MVRVNLNRNVVMNPVLHFNMMKRRSRAGLLSCLAIVGLVLLLGHTDETWGRWIAYLATCAAMVFMIHQLPGTSKISLDPDGISIRSPFWQQRLDWRNLRGFVLVDFSREHPGHPENCRVGYLVADEQRDATPETSLKIFAPLGCHGLLPQIDGVDPSRMVRLLNGVLVARGARKE